MGKCVVSVVEHPGGIAQGCKRCGEILHQGKFTIGLFVYANGIEYKYLLGGPREMHCGEEKNFLMCFKTEEDAEAEKQNVLSHVQKNGSTEGLRLMEIVVMDTSIH